MRAHSTTRALGAAAALLTCTLGPAAAQLTEANVRDYLWSADAQVRNLAVAAITADPASSAMTRVQAGLLRDWIVRGPSFAVAPGTGDTLHEMIVAAPGGREVPTLVRLPSAYTPERPWPVLLAMHGGPPGSVAGALSGAVGMISVWATAADSAGWIVAAPAMVDVVSRDGRTADRLPYEIFQPEEARAVVDAVGARFHVDPDRIVSTGISLGSNFSIAYAAAHPHWFSAIVPVSTEGESREWLLRNLATVPTYVLEGAQDQNIRGVSGPRALDAILTRLGYDLVYREFEDRAHEGFQEHYPEVLDWLEERPRGRPPPEVLRVPHAGIVPLSRRVHWVESGTRQGVVRASAAGDRITVTAQWTDSVTLWLDDDLVDLDRPLAVEVNGRTVHEGGVQRSALLALEEVRRSGDRGRVFTARLTVPVPTDEGASEAGRRLVAELEPEHPEGILSYWETYAVRALEERYPEVGFTGTEVALPPDVAAGGQVGIRVDAVTPGSAVDRAGLRPGDVVVRFGGEPFYAGRGSTELLLHWLVRELRSAPREYDVLILREGRMETRTARVGLGPYRPPAD